MMAQPSSAPFSSPVSLIGSQFMAPHQFDILVDKISSGNLVITNTNHKIMFKVKPCDTSFHHQRQVFDVDDKPIVLIREKIMSEHNRWKAFRGNSTKSKSDVIFIAKDAHVIQFRTNVHVFLGNKTSGNDVCDFNIKGSWSKKNCTIYMGDSSTAIAQMYPSSENVKDFKKKFMVTIYPNIDYAFVVTLLAIVEAMKSSNEEVAIAASMGIGAGFSY